MGHKNQTIICRDCETSFTFTVQEQKEFRKRNFNPPSRCEACHERRSSRRIVGRGGDVELHTTKCSSCGGVAEVPFKPIGDKPIFCNACFNEKTTAQVRLNRRDFVVKKPKAVPIQVIETVCEAPMASDFDQFNLDECLNRVIKEAGYVTATPVQEAAIPIALSGRDLIGTAQTGTGKTAAFVLPIIQYLLENPVKKPRTRAIVLTPTRELAEQINDAIRMFAKHTNIRSATLYGGVPMFPQERALRTGADIIVACPGRLLDHANRGNTNFTRVEKLVIDEADRMLDMGFLPPIEEIISLLPKERQTMLYSATFAPDLMNLVKEHMTEPERIHVDLALPPNTVAHALYPCRQNLKTPLLLKLLEKADLNSVLIFTRTKHRANQLAEKIEAAGYQTRALHSNKSQGQRQSALNDFKSGRCQVLVATDIAARGIDVDTISHVINFDIPDGADTYIHRIGRTGRAHREGEAMTMVTANDSRIIWEIEKTLGSKIQRVHLEDFDYDMQVSRDLVLTQSPFAQQGAPKPGGRSFDAPSKPKSFVTAQKLSNIAQNGPRKTGVRINTNAEKPTGLRPPSPGYFATNRKKTVKVSER